MTHNKKRTVPIRGPHHIPRLVTVSDETDRQGDTRRISASSPEDILAYIQCTLGFAAKNSFVVVAFDDQQLSTVVRCDLPESLQQMLRSDTPECVTFLDFGLTEAQELQFVELGRHIGELIAQEPSTTSCLVLYLADEVTVSPHRALAVTGTANSIISAQFGLQRLPVTESWLIHHDCLWHLRCAATLECAVQGIPVGDPEDTEIFRSLDPTGITSVRHHPNRKLTFPPVSMTRREQLQDTQYVLDHQPNTALSWLKLWDHHLRTGPQMLHSDQVSQMLESLEHAPLRQAVQALACFDVTKAVKGMVKLGRFPKHMLASHEQHISSSDGVRVNECLTGESQDAPDWGRIGELERLCHQLLPLSDAHSGGVVAGLLVWIEWVRGRGSVAMTHVKQARKHFPDEPFLLTLEDYLQRGLVAAWATRLDSAWSPQHAA